MKYLLLSNKLSYLTRCINSVQLLAIKVTITYWQRYNPILRFFRIFVMPLSVEQAIIPEIMYPKDNLCL